MNIVSAEAGSRQGWILAMLQRETKQSCTQRYIHWDVRENSSGSGKHSVLQHVDLFLM